MLKFRAKTGMERSRGRQAEQANGMTEAQQAKFTDYMTARLGS